MATMPDLVRKCCTFWNVVADDCKQLRDHWAEREVVFHR